PPDQIELVAAPGAMLRFPEVALPIEGQTLRIAMTDSPDLRIGPVTSDEGVTWSRLAIGGDAQNLAEMGVKSLRHQPGVGAAGVPISDSQIQVSVRSHHHAPARPRTHAGTIVIWRLRPRSENDSNVADGVGALVEGRSRNLQSADHAAVESE